MANASPNGQSDAQSPESDACPIERQAIHDESRMLRCNLTTGHAGPHIDDDVQWDDVAYIQGGGE